MLNSRKFPALSQKKHPKPELGHLTPDETGAILSAAEADSRYGRRDLVLLTLLYDSAARMQEICDLRARDVRLQKPYIVKLTGKGKKIRCVPIMGITAERLKKYADENRLDTPEKAGSPFFFNHKGDSLQGPVLHNIKEILQCRAEGVSRTPWKDFAPCHEKSKLK